MAAQSQQAISDIELDDVFESYGPLNVDAFIDSQFAFALRGEEDINHDGTQLAGSKMEVQNVDAGCVAMLESFAFGSATQLNLDRTISLTSPQGDLEDDTVCPYCRRTLERDELVDDCRTLSGINNVVSETTERETTNGCTIHGGVDVRGEPINPRTTVVTELQLADISDDVGTCWRELGPKLEIAASKIQNLDEEYKYNRDKANALLIMWKQKEASRAIAGILADALESIGRKSIAEKLLGVNEVNTCVSVDEGHLISLTVKFDLDAELDNKLMLCEDAQGNKFMLKALSNSEKFWNTEEILKNKRFLETVAVAAQDMGKTPEQRRQESLKRISSEVQELRQQLKKVKLDCGDADLSESVKNCPIDEAQPTCDSSEDAALMVHQSQGESVEQLIQSCEEQRRFCQGIYDALIKLIGEVGQPREDNAKCIRQLCDFTKELRDQEKTIFSKIELLRGQNQHLDKHPVSRVEQLEKWQRAQKEQVEGVEKLLSSLLHQGGMERRQSQGKMERQKLLNRRSEPILSTKSSSGHGRRRTKTDSSKHSAKSQSLNELSDVNKKSNISSPLCVRRMYVMDMDKKLSKEKKDKS